MTNPAQETPRLQRPALRAKPLTFAGAIERDPSLLEGPAIAIVGARAASRAALDFAHELGRLLARADRLVISGGALGTDGAAHEGALSVDGRTVAVLGTGIDVAYPARHAPIFARMLARGGLVSPFDLGEQPRRGHFPVRNPFIAALSDAVVVVEAGLRSGSLGTARAALSLGLPLYCYPGSPGCDALIASRQAKPAAQVAWLADHLITGAAHVASPALAAGSFESIVLGACATASDAGSLAASLGEPLSIVLECLLELELSRRVMRFPDGRYLALTGSVELKG